MTGFGRALGEVGGTRVAVEVATLNHRNRELHVYLPARWSRFDPLARKVVAGYLRRGKARISVRVPEDEAAGGVRWRYHPEVAQVYLDAFADLKERLGSDETPRALDILGLRGVVAASEGDPLEEDEGEGEALEELLSQACEALVRARTQEGEALQRDLEARLTAMEELAAQVEDQLPRIREMLMLRFRSRIDELTQGTAVPEERLLTESALYVDRLDVHEELVRLQAHVQTFRETLEQGGACGRRLAFLGQEMNREANTLGAKATDPECSRVVVRLKDEVAKVREQVENLE